MDRLREKTTWVGLVTLVTVGFGWGVAPEQIEIIASAVAALAGAALVWMRERK